MKVKTFELINLIQLLASAKLTKLEPKEKTAVVKAVCAMKREGEAWDAFLKEAQKRCRPDDYEELAGMIGRKEELAEAERAEAEARWDEYRKAVDAVAMPELESVKEIGTDGIGEDVVEKLCDSNDWSVGAMMAVRSAFLGE